MIDWLAETARARRPSLVRAPGEGRVLGRRGQARARRAACPATRCIRASRTPTSPTWPAHASCSMQARTRSTRSSPRTTRTPSPPMPSRRAGSSVRIPAPARHGRRPLCRSDRPNEPRTCRAACTRRSARTKTCCPTWCVACSRTARTPASSTASSTKACRSRELVADPVRDRARASPRIPHPRISAAGRNLASSAAQLSEEFHGRQLRQRQRTAAHSPSRDPEQDWSVDRRAAGAGRESGRRHACRSPIRPIAARSSAAMHSADAATIEKALANAVAAQPDWDRLPAASRAAILEHAADLLEAAPRRIHRAVRARSRQDAARRHRRSARGGRFPALLRRHGAPPVRSSGTASRPDRREQPAVLARPRRVRLHQPVELPAGDLPGPGRRRPGRRQRRDRQARRTDQPDRLRRREAAARGRRAGRACCSSCPATAPSSAPR